MATINNNLILFFIPFLLLYRFVEWIKKNEIQFKLNGDKTINETAFETQLLNMFVSEDYERAEVNHVVGNCGKSKLFRIKPGDLTSYECNPLPFMHWQCIKHSLFLACPTDLQVEADECEVARNASERIVGTVF